MVMISFNPVVKKTAEGKILAHPGKTFGKRKTLVIEAALSRRDDKYYSVSVGISKSDRDKILSTVSLLHFKLKVKVGQN